MASTLKIEIYKCIKSKSNNQYLIQIDRSYLHKIHHKNNLSLCLQLMMIDSFKYLKFNFILKHLIMSLHKFHHLNILLKDHQLQLILLRSLRLMIMNFSFSFRFSRMFQHKFHHRNNLKLFPSRLDFAYHFKALLSKLVASF